MITEKQLLMQGNPLNEQNHPQDIAKALQSDRLRANRPFPDYLWHLFQSESWCSSVRMKISFQLHVSGEHQDSL